MHALVDIPESGEIPFTDYSLWRLEADDGGRHVWRYLSEEEASKWPQSTVEKYWLGLPTVSRGFYSPKWHHAYGLAHGLEISRTCQNLLLQKIPFLQRAKDSISTRICNLLMVTGQENMAGLCSYFPDLSSDRMSPEWISLKLSD